MSIISAAQSLRTTGTRGRGRIFAVGALAVLLAAIAYLAYGQFLARPVETPVAAPTVPVRRGSVTATVSSTGNVVAARQAKLTFTQGGRLREMNVQLGDAVKEGQAIARVDSTALELRLAQAQSSLRTAQIKLEQFKAGAKPEDIAQAQAALEAAKLKLDDVKAGPTTSDLATAQSQLDSATASLASAQAKLDTLKAGPTAADLATAQGAVDSAGASVRSAQARLDQLRAGPTVADVRAAEQSVAAARASLQKTQTDLDKVKAGATAEELTAAQSAVDQARSAGVEQAVVSARAALQKAQTDLDKVKAGATPEELSAAQAAVDQAKNSLWATQIDRDATCGRVKSTDPQCQSANARSAIQETSVQQAIAKLDQLKAKPAATDVQLADSALATARESLKSAEARAAAQTSAIQTAEARLGAVKAKPDPKDVAIAESSVTAARESLRSADARLAQVTAGASASDVATAQGSLESANANLASAQAKLDALKAGPTAADFAAAQGAVDTAQSNLKSAQARFDQVKAGAKPADVQSARASLAQAEATFLLKKAPPATLDLALLEESVKVAEISLKQAQNDLDNTVLIAPFPGIVGAITVNVGEQVGAGTAVLTLVDPRSSRVDLTVDENDIAKLAIGKEAIITFDSLPAQRLRGKVVGIAPNATIQQGVATYGVAVGVENSDATIPAGLTANVTIVTENRDNVLLVPNRAIRRVGRVQSVEVMLGDKTEARQVRTGLANDQVTEILEGLQENEIVIIPTTQAANPRLAGFGQPASQQQFVAKPAAPPPAGGAAPAGGGAPAGGAPAGGGTTGGAPAGGGGWGAGGGARR